MRNLAKFGQRAKFRPPTKVAVSGKAANGEPGLKTGQATSDPILGVAGKELICSW